MLLIGILSTSCLIALIPEKVSNIFLYRIGTILFLFSAILSYNCQFNSAGVYENFENVFGIYGGLWQINVMNTSITTFIYIISAIALLITEKPLIKSSLKEFSIQRNLILNSSLELKSEYPLVIILSVMGMICLISSYDLISFFLGIELQSLSLYVLTTIYRESESATSAGLKYFLLGGLSSGFILLGCSLLYGLTGTTNFEYLNMIASSQSYNQINLSLFIIGIGLLFKIAAAPFHNWAPDVYDGVPTLVTSWITVLPKISIIIFITEFYNNIFFQFTALQSLFLFSAFLSLIIGSILGLNQSRLKRLLAYSSISHIGFLLLAIGTQGSQSIESLIFYLIQYSLTTLVVFYILIIFGNSSSATGFYSPIQTISQLKAQFKESPILALCLAINLFSMAGIPPCIGFFGKFFILYSSIIQELYFIVLIAIVASVISAFYYLKIIQKMTFSNWSLTSIKTDLTQSVALNFFIPTYITAFIVAVPTLASILFILNPTPILNFVHSIAIAISTTAIG